MRQLNKKSKYLAACIGVIVVGLLVWQYMGYRQQVTRHQNALQFWQVEVPKVQKTYPNFKPVDVPTKVAEENAQFKSQKIATYRNYGIIILGGFLGIGLIYYVPRIKKRGNT